MLNMPFNSKFYYFVDFLIIWAIAITEIILTQCLGIRTGGSIVLSSISKQDLLPIIHVLQSFEPFSYPL